MNATGQSELVKRAAVARFLGKDLAEVQSLIDLDNLPHTKVPAPKRDGVRVFLPDFHDWLVKRSRLSPKLAIYPEFKRAFFAAQPRKEAADATH